MVYEVSVLVFQLLIISLSTPALVDAYFANKICKWSDLPGNRYDISPSSIRWFAWFSLDIVVYMDGKTIYERKAATICFRDAWRKIQKLENIRAVHEDI
jgi:hypothetical protein